MSTVTSDDVNLTSAVANRSWDYPSSNIYDAPAAFIDIHECAQFSLTVFMIKAKKRMPLHDHPEMFGLM